MEMRLRRRFLPAALFVCVVAAPAPSPAPAQTAATPARTETALAPGVTYRHIYSATPQGEPWSIHVLEVSRGEKHLMIRAVAGAGAEGEMQRELPTQLAARAPAAREHVLGVVNGDYDLAAPYLGISDGLAVTSRRLWTTGHPTRPVFAFLRAGEPLIAVPAVTIQLTAGKNRWAIGALNKPLGALFGPEPRLFTREFRASVKSETPLAAVVIERLSPPAGGPLGVDSTVRGIVREKLDPSAALGAGAAREVSIPRDALVLVEHVPSADTGATPPRTPISVLRPGQKVKLRIRVEMNDRRGIRDAVGGFPILVREGRRDIVGTPSANLAQRHPRTAACYNEQKVIFAVVDGRQPQLSVGMTLEELADLMVSLGCTVAMNTDGGGSSVMAIAPPPSENVGAQPAAPASNLQIVNSPSDGRERGRGNAWVIVAKP